MIAQATVEVDGKGKIQHDKVIARQEGDFPVIEPTNVNYTDVAPNQIASISASTQSWGDSISMSPSMFE